MAGCVLGTTRYLERRLEGRALILMYHRVLPLDEVEGTFVQPGMYVTPRTFELHLRYLTARFAVVPLQELLARWQDGTWSREARYCAITFDDGWVDNYRHAFPLLRKHRVPATIFLPTDLIGTTGWLWSDRLGYLMHRCGSGGSGDVDRAIEHAKSWTADARERLIAGLERKSGATLPRQRCFLDWREVREMSRHGVRFGSHTSSHAILTRLDAASLESELRRPLATLASQCDAPLPILAYPNGDHSEPVAAAARMAGYRAAVTTKPGAEPRRPGDLYGLRRVGVHEDVARSVPLFTFHIARQLALSS